ncbi:MAG: sialidase family protein [Massilia sp.]
MILCQRMLRAALCLPLLCSPAVWASTPRAEGVDDLLQPREEKLLSVAISVTANTGQIRGFDQIWVSRISTEGDTPLRVNFVLEQLAPGMARDTALFIGKVPPGTYRVSELKARAAKKIVRLPENAHLANFVVGTEKQVDLGRLIVTPIGTNVLFGRSRRVVSNQHLMERFAPVQAALFARGADPGWLSGKDALAEGEAEADAMRHPVGADCMTELTDGRVIAASRMNTVLVRDQAGHWSTLRGPGMESLLCVTPVDAAGTDMLAVGEFLTLLRKPTGVDQLVPVDTGNLPFGTLLYICGNDTAGWFLALQHDNELTIFHSTALEAGNWSPMRTENVAAEFLSGTSKFWMWQTAQGFAYTTVKGPLNYYNTASKTWTARATPKDAHLFGLTVTPTGSLGALTSPALGVGGIFASTFVSSDQASTWQEIQVPFKSKVAPPVPARDGKIFMPGGILSTPELQVSADGGTTWTQAGLYTLGRRITPLSSGALLDADLGQTGMFTIRVSRDEGKSWQVEYRN